MKYFSIILKLLALAGTIRVLTQQQKTIMKIGEAIDIINEANEGLIKAKGEILGELARLQNGKDELTPAQAEIVNRLKVKVKDMDDIIPDPVDPVEGEPAPAEPAEPIDPATPPKPVEGGGEGS